MEQYQGEKKLKKTQWDRVSNYFTSLENFAVEIGADRYMKQEDNFQTKIDESTERKNKLDQLLQTDETLDNEIRSLKFDLHGARINNDDLTIDEITTEINERQTRRDILAMKPNHQIVSKQLGDEIEKLEGKVNKELEKMAKIRTTLTNTLEEQLNSRVLDWINQLKESNLSPGMRMKSVIQQLYEEVKGDITIQLQALSQKMFDIRMQLLLERNE